MGGSPADTLTSTAFPDVFTAILMLEDWLETGASVTLQVGEGARDQINLAGLVMQAPLYLEKTKLPSVPNERVDAEASADAPARLMM